MKTHNAFIIIFIINFIENIGQLIFLGVELTKQTLIGSLLFTLTLTLILKQMKVIE